MTGPLKGINILDFGMNGVGPWAASVLGTLGASVIKVERPSRDNMWNQQPFQNGFPLGYTNWNMSKKAIVVDLKSTTGRAAIEPLVREADVVMSNLRPGKMDNIGMGYEKVRGLNPNIVHASCPGWGEEGPLANRPFADPQSQAFSGFASLNGDEEGKPEIFRHSYHLDLVTSTYLASSVLLGLLARERTGKGKEMKCSHLGSSISVCMSRLAEYFLSGHVPGPLGSASASTAPHQVFLCQDGRYVAIGVENQTQWEGLCGALAREDLKADLRFITNQDRVSHRPELSQILQETLGSKPARWWAVQLEKNGVPYGYPYDFETLRNHAQVLENRFIELVDIPHQGKVYVGGVPWRFSGTPASMYSAPRSGEHTEELFARGFDAFDVQTDSPSVSTLGTTRDDDPPLAGIKVVEMAQGLCGPLTGLLLADAGAEVIKVEPPSGDYAREFAPKSGESDGAAFLILNRNKKSVTLDIDTPDGRRHFLDIVKDADIVIEDWGPGKAEERGLSYEVLKQSNPRLLWCAISPFGEAGPFKDRPGSELVFQMMAEYWASLGDREHAPLRVGADVANLSTGAMAFLGLLAALYHRSRSGAGQRVAVSMLGTLLIFRQPVWSVQTCPDQWAGIFTSAYTSPRNSGFEMGDKQYYLSMGERTDWKALIEDIGFGADTEAIIAKLRDYRGQFQYAFQDEVFEGRERSEVLTLFEKHDANAIPFNNLKEVLEHPQTETLGLIETVDHPGLGALRVLRSPWRGPWKNPVATPAPVLGHHGPIQTPIMREV